jgi:hypothetical protein
MTRSKPKKLIKKTIVEANTDVQISPRVKKRMLERLRIAIKHVKKINTVYELASLDSSEYDTQKGTFVVQIYSNRNDR